MIDTATNDFFVSCLQLNCIIVHLHLCTNFNHDFCSSQLPSLMNQLHLECPSEHFSRGHSTMEC